MSRRDLVTIACGLTLALLPATASAQTELTGQTGAGAHYKIVVPDGWTPANGLVIWNHGFDLSPTGPVEDLGPLVDVQLAEGYAVAASSYSLTGWALYRTRLDTTQLLNIFGRSFGNPDEIIVIGVGMGALVALQTIETGTPKVVGALLLAGALAGSPVWEEAVDLRLMYDFICGKPQAFVAHPGVGHMAAGQIPGGANGLPFPLDPALDQAAIADLVDACLGIRTLPKDRNPQQVFWLGFLRDLTRGSKNDVVSRLMYSTFGLHDLVFDPLKQRGKRGIGNRDATYADFFIDLNIDRVGSVGSARRLMRNYTPTGNVGDVKIISIHTDKDGLVLVENQSEYASVVPPENLTTAIVIEQDPSHAGFTEAETVAAWETLRGWVAGNPQPTRAQSRPAVGRSW